MTRITFSQHITEGLTTLTQRNHLQNSRTMYANDTCTTVRLRPKPNISKCKMKETMWTYDRNQLNKHVPFTMIHKLRFYTASVCKQQQWHKLSMSNCPQHNTVQSSVTLLEGTFAALELMPLFTCVEHLNTDWAEVWMPQVFQLAQQLGCQLLEYLKGWK